VLKVFLLFKCLIILALKWIYLGLKYKTQIMCVKSKHARINPFWFLKITRRDIDILDQKFSKKPFELMELHILDINIG
jgi:hypothetical protein